MNSLVHWFIIAIVILPAATACAGTEAKLDYQPPIAPVTFKINHRGEVSIEGELSVVTPLGRFGIGADIPVADLGADIPDINDNDLILIIRNRNSDPSDDVYHISDGRNARIVTDGRTEFIAESRKAIIDVTEGTVQRIDIIDFAAPTPSSPRTQSPQCPLSPRLKIGDRGRVLPYPPLHNFLRQEPGKDGTVFERIEYGRTFTVIDGPICADEINWWYVRSYEDIEGWTAEGEDGMYFVESLD